MQNTAVIGDPNKDPYLKAIGKEIVPEDTTVSNEDQIRFEEFYYISEAYRASVIASN